MVDRKEKIKFVFMILTLVAVVVNAFYFYELYRLVGEKTFILTVIEVFDVLLSLFAYVLSFALIRNYVSDVSYFLWYIDAFISVKGPWDYGRKPFMFVKQWRMYSSFEELKAEVDELKHYYIKFRQLALISVILFLPVILCNSVEVLFCGESARIYTLWNQNVAFYLFFIPKCIFALLFAISLMLYFHYKDKVKILAYDPLKSRLTAADVSNL